MIIVSSRKDFTNPNKLSSQKEHQFRDIDLSQEKKSGNILSEGEFFQELYRLSNKRILMLVHGYNNEHNKMCNAYSTIEKNVTEYIKNQYDIVIGYSWPGGKHPLAWWLAKSNADKTAKRLKALIKSIYTKIHVLSLDVMSHSLGARVMLEMLKQFPKVISGDQPPVRNYFCMAAAVDDEVLELSEKFHTSVNKINGIYIFHSKHDSVLREACKLAESDSALGTHGAENLDKTGKNVYFVNCEHYVEKHGDYKRVIKMYKYMSKVLDKKHINKVEIL